MNTSESSMVIPTRLECLRLQSGLARTLACILTLHVCGCVCVKMSPNLLKLRRWTTFRRVIAFLCWPARPHPPRSRRHLNTEYHHSIGWCHNHRYEGDAEVFLVNCPADDERADEECLTRWLKAGLLDEDKMYREVCDQLVAKEDAIANVQQRLRDLPFLQLYGTPAGCW